MCVVTELSGLWVITQVIKSHIPTLVHVVHFFLLFCFSFAVLSYFCYSFALCFIRTQGLLVGQQNMLKELPCM